jgi:hypothetical protein
MIQALSLFPHVRTADLQNEVASGDVKMTYVALSSGESHFRRQPFVPGVSRSSVGYPVPSGFSFPKAVEHGMSRHLGLPQFPICQPSQRTLSERMATNPGAARPANPKLSVIDTVYLGTVVNKLRPVATILAENVAVTILRNANL